MAQPNKIAAGSICNRQERVREKGFWLRGKKEMGKESVRYPCRSPRYHSPQYAAPVSNSAMPRPCGRPMNHMPWYWTSHTSVNSVDNEIRELLSKNVPFLSEPSFPSLRDPTKFTQPTLSRFIQVKRPFPCRLPLRTCRDCRKPLFIPTAAATFK